MQRNQKILIVFFAALSFTLSGTLFAQYQSAYPDIPIIDVHVHPGNAVDIANFIKVSETIKEKNGSHLAFWIGLSDPGNRLEEMKEAGQGRFLFSASQMQPHRGLKMTAEEVVAKVQDGYVGLKFWFGPAYRVLKEGEEGITLLDDLRYEEFFTALEKANVLMTSLHIADPNQVFGDRGKWLKDPVYYWEQIRAFENVVAKYPNMTFIAAHGAWLVCQDAQIDYLRYMFKKYPNLYVDISATCHYMPLVKHENLRDFYIEYQDRLLFGTDGGRVGDDNMVNYIASRYANFFAILETDEVVPTGFFGNFPTQGLHLPREVLEKIYYKNALKLYPGLREAMFPEQPHL